jgi:hypothetical protein
MITLTAQKGYDNANCSSSEIWYENDREKIHFAHTPQYDSANLKSQKSNRDNILYGILR